MPKKSRARRLSGVSNTTGVLVRKMATTICRDPERGRAEWQRRLREPYTRDAHGRESVKGFSVGIPAFFSNKCASSSNARLRLGASTLSAMPSIVRSEATGFIQKTANRENASVWFELKHFAHCTALPERDSICFFSGEVYGLSARPFTQAFRRNLLDFPVFGNRTAGQMDAVRRKNLGNGASDSAWQDFLWIRLPR